jgi:hypothetical protein
MYLILAIILVIVLMVYYARCDHIDTFDDFYSNYHAIERQSLLNKQNQQLFNDISFDDVKYYENDMKSGQTGLDKCLLHQAGECVEFGITGNAYYYPPSKTNKYFGEVLNLDPEQIHNDNENKVSVRNINEYLHFPKF